MAKKKKELLVDLEKESKDFIKDQEDIYISKDGFEKVPLIRGVCEIAPILEDLKKHSETFVCGGYVRYCASPKRNPVIGRDVDLYSMNEEAFDKIKKFYDDQLTIQHENDISVTYKKPEWDSDSKYLYVPTIQLIKPVKEGKVVGFGTMEEVIENFDFTVVRIALLDEKTALADADFLHDERHGLLRLKNIHCPISSTLRCMKYAKKGYWLKPLETFKLFLDWDQKSDEYKSKLQDWLNKANAGKGLTQNEVNELERMMMVD